jgi:hypothetical protein
VPVAAVIRKMQALSGIIGRQAFVSGRVLGLTGVIVLGKHLPAPKPEVLPASVQDSLMHEITKDEQKIVDKICPNTELYDDYFSKLYRIYLNVWTSEYVKCRRADDLNMNNLCLQITTNCLSIIKKDLKIMMSISEIVESFNI